MKKIIIMIMISTITSLVAQNRCTDANGRVVTCVIDNAPMRFVGGVTTAPSNDKEQERSYRKEECKKCNAGSVEYCEECRKEEEQTKLEVRLIPTDETPQERMKKEFSKDEDAEAIINAYPIK